MRLLWMERLDAPRSGDGRPMRMVGGGDIVLPGRRERARVWGEFYLPRWRFHAMISYIFFLMIPIGGTREGTPPPKKIGLGNEWGQGRGGRGKTKSRRRKKIPPQGHGMEIDPPGGPKAETRSRRGPMAEEGGRAGQRGDELVGRRPRKTSLGCSKRRPSSVGGRGEGPGWQAAGVG